MILLHSLHLEIHDDSDPFLLVGHRIIHRFSVSHDEDRWFEGSVLDYDPVNRTHTVAYDSESDLCSFNLMEDILSGDLKVLN